MTDDILLRPAPMEGKGAYNRGSRVQAAGLLPAVALFERAAKAAALDASRQPVVIADYGASQGHNSLLPISVAIDAVRERAGSERAICVVHTDLPGNDFTALFHTLASDPESYLRGRDRVFPSAVGRSFYEQILPDDSVTLGWSSWSVQWLSRVPAEIPDQVQVAYSHDAAVQAAYARQAAEDWQNFLSARSRELRAGGQLIVLAMAVDDKGAFGYRPLLEAIYDALNDLVSVQLIDPGELRRMAIPTVGRSRTEFAAPFAKDGRFQGLAIEDLNVFAAEDRIWQQYEADRDAQAFGAKWAAFTRASVFPTLAAALDPGRGDLRPKLFMDQLEAGVAARLAAAPSPMLIPLAKMTIVKAGSASARPAC
jgi:hypothetical protein